MDSLLSDARFAVRALVARPGFSALAVQARHDLVGIAIRRRKVGRRSQPEERVGVVSDALLRLRQRRPWIAAAVPLSEARCVVRLTNDHHEARGGVDRSTLRGALRSSVR